MRLGTKRNTFSFVRGLTGCGEGVLDIASGLVRVD